MAFSRHFYPEHDFVYTQCYGVVDDNSLRVHLLSFAIDAKGMKKIKELADARGIEKADRATVRGIIELADLDRKQSAGREETLAILATQPLIHEMARIYADLLKPFKNGIAIFDDEKEALSWLGYTGRKGEILQKFIERNRL